MNYLILFLLFFNSFVLFFLAIFLVRLRQRLDGFMRDILDLMEFSLPPENVASVGKTWDQKYEEDLNDFYRRIRRGSELKDLPDPTVSWGQPPAPNPQDGLTIKDK